MLILMFDLVQDSQQIDEFHNSFYHNCIFFLIVLLYFEQQYNIQSLVCLLKCPFQ